MHYEDRLYWDRCSKKYPRYFNDPSKIIEFGSFNINGSIRDWFNCSNYTGLDWIAGPCHDAPFKPESFNTVVSASMLEHDPYWEKSITKMVEVLRPDGLFAISWGAARNLLHHLEMAPDGGFHALRAGLVLQLLEKLELYVHEFQYDRTICLDHGDEEFIKDHKVREDPMYGMGETVIVGFKDKAYAAGERIIEPLIEEDMIL